MGCSKGHCHTVPLNLICIIALNQLISKSRHWAMVELSAMERIEISTGRLTSDGRTRSRIDQRLMDGELIIIAFGGLISDSQIRTSIELGMDRKSIIVVLGRLISERTRIEPRLMDSKSIVVALRWSVRDRTGIDLRLVDGELIIVLLH
jgi:hypothetical protein